jgi:hypothetical protein
MLGDFGHACLAASIESMMHVTMEGDADEDASLLRDLQCQ